jgi:hypothetical protein
MCILGVIAVMKELIVGDYSCLYEGNNTKTHEVAGESAKQWKNLLDRCGKDGQDTTL